MGPRRAAAACYSAGAHVSPRLAEPPSAEAAGVARDRHVSRSGPPPPRRIRLWHFVLVPALAMGVLIALSRLVDRLVLPGLSGAAAELYVTSRTGAISLAMASLVAWLAVRYRREYEEELRARNRALEQTRDFLARIVEGSAEAIVTLDAEGRVTSWNRAAEQIFGWTSAEMIGQSAIRVVPPEPEAVDDFRWTNERVRSGQTVRAHEATRLRRDGRRITVQITRSPLYDADGRFAGSTSIVRDMTAIKEMEARLLERERLAAVGELAARVAHEVRNPLAGIRGGCEILLEGYPAGDAKREIGEETLRQVDRLSRTVQELLLFARPRAVEPAPTDVHEVLEHALRALREDPRTREVRLERAYDRSLPPLRLDPQQMEQVFVNVLLNAFQAMEFRGTVRIATRRDGAAAEVAVRDTGPGIRAEVMDNLFKPFFTTRAQGTGLGLSIVRGIVEAHGGTVRAASPPGGGAEFTVRLPLEGS